jgi:hypothetical protein
MLAQGQEIWAQNRTNPLGVLAATMASGKDHLFPASKDPVCLSVLFTEDDLRKSPDLRNLTIKNALVLLTRDQASAYFKAARKPMAPEPPPKSTTIQSAIKEDPEMEPLSEAKATSPQASPRIIQMATSLQHPSLSDEEVIEAIKEELPSMESTDVAYLLTMTNRKPVKQWLAHMMIADEAGEDAQTGDDLTEGNPDTPTPATKVLKTRKMVRKIGAQ